MALGKANTRVRSHMGDNCQLKFGAGPTWSSIGKTNRWKLSYELETKTVVFADETELKIQSVRRATIEIDLAQTHPDEMGLIDDLRNTSTVSFWGNAGTIGTDVCELYAPEVEIAGVSDLETPAGDNMKIKLSLSLAPQSAVVTGVGTAFPTDSIQGDAVTFTGENEFFAYFVASAT